jgi:GNAT superfamily N-acetyltransferase
MMGFDIKMYENHGLSPAVTMAQRMHLELLETGLTHPSIQLPVWNDPALVAFHGETAVGAMIYRHDQTQGSWYIMSSYVMPEYRRQGVHSLLFETLVERAKKRGDILAIHSGTHIDNEASRRSQEAQGRKLYAVYYEYRIRDFDEPTDPLEVKAAG